MKRVTVADAPAVLNTNDKAFWAIGWNDCAEATESDRVSRDVPADLAAVLLELDTPIAGLLGSHSGKFVPGTSKDSKEFDAFESAIPLVRWTDHERTCRKIAALAALPKPQPVCPTCSGHGMIGGPSFYAPDEGGVPCPDCNQPQPVQAQPSDDKAFKLNRLMGLIDDIIEVDPDRAERLLESILARSALRKRLADKQPAEQAQKEE